MFVLLSCKTTNLDVHGELIRKRTVLGNLSQAHLARLQDDHRQHHLCRQRLLVSLRQYGINYQEVQRGLYWPDLQEVDAIITVGGDGTVLEASHHVLRDDLPVIGLRSSAMSVGKLCSYNLETLDEMIQALLGGNLRLQKVKRLRAIVHYSVSGGSLSTDPVLNDFLYANSSPAATTRYMLSLGAQEEVQKSSGVWLATPMGSTAAISAAGGQVLTPAYEGFQYLVREPYAAPGKPPLLMTKGFFSQSTNFVIENHCENGLLALDGQHGSIRLGFGDRVQFTEAEALNLVMPA